MPIECRHCREMQWALRRLRRGATVEEAASEIAARFRLPAGAAAEVAHAVAAARAIGEALASARDAADIQAVLDRAPIVWGLRSGIYVGLWISLPVEEAARGEPQPIPPLHGADFREVYIRVNPSGWHSLIRGLGERLEDELAKATRTIESIIARFVQRGRMTPSESAEVDRLRQEQQRLGRELEGLREANRALQQQPEPPPAAPPPRGGIWQQVWGTIRRFLFRVSWLFWGFA